MYTLRCWPNAASPPHTIAVIAGVIIGCGVRASENRLHEVPGRWGMDEWGSLTFPRRDARYAIC